MTYFMLVLCKTETNTAKLREFELITFILKLGNTAVKMLLNKTKEFRVDATR